MVLIHVVRRAAESLRSTFFSISPSSVAHVIAIMSSLFLRFLSMCPIILFLRGKKCMSINQSINKLYLPSNLQCSTQVLISSSHVRMCVLGEERRRGEWGGARHTPCPFSRLLLPCIEYHHANKMAARIYA